MAKFKTYSNEQVEINPGNVVSVSEYDFYDQDKAIDQKLRIKNPDGLDEDRSDDEGRAAVAKARTSKRTLVLLASGLTFEVLGTAADTKKALAKR